MKRLITLISFILFLGNFAFTQIIETQGIFCPGEATGRLHVISGFGTSPYTYLWNTGSTEQIIEGLPAGTYSVTVTDDLLVSQIFTYDLLDPTPITSAYVITPNSNWPNPNGSISITPNGGTGWITYELKDSTTNETNTQTNNLFNNLYSGTYFIALTDLNGCQRRDTIIVGEASEITTDLTIDYTACYKSTANIDVRPSLTLTNLPAQVIFPEETITIINIITGPRPYVTSDLDTLANISNAVNPGRNLLNIVTNDNKGFRYSWVVLEPSNPITLTFDEPRHVICYGNNTGFIHGINAQGSYGNFTYSTTGPDGFSSSNRNLNDLYSGLYLITATDSSNNCSITLPVTILQPDLPIQGDLVGRDLTCFQSNDGEIIANFAGGTGQLNYIWDSGQTTASITGLAAGNYTLTITDENDCTLIPAAVEINEPSRLHVTDVVVPVDCYNYDNASIITTVIGGNGGNSFVWKKDGIVMNYNTNAITNLGSGIYDLHLKDSLGCVFDTIWTLSNPANFQFEFINTLISCNDELGTIRVHNLELFPLDVTISGIIQNISFDDTISFTDITIGNHLVSISNGTCSFDTTIFFTQPEPLIIYVNTLDNKCFDGVLGEIEVEVRGGTSGPNTTCLIDGRDFRGNIVTRSFPIPARNFVTSDLPAGLYGINIEDDDGCGADENVVIDQPIEPIRIHFGFETTYCQESEDGKAWVNYAENGLMPINYLWENGKTSFDSDSLEVGWYSVLVTDANGCTAIDSVEIMAGNYVCIPNTITPNNDGYNDVLDLSNLCYYSDIKIIIVDRLGNIIFETKDCSISWDGRDKKGNLLHSGSIVFAYVKQIKNDGSSKEFRKAITVIY